MQFLKLMLPGLLLWAACATAKDVTITDFGAKADGKTVATQAIQKAIDACNQSGGGQVIVPAGTFVTGTIFIKDNVTLFLSPSARIKGSGDIKDYKEMTWGGDGNIDRQPFHLVMAKDARNIGISGTGTIDGNGPAFFEPHSGKTPRWIKAKKSKVSPMIELQNCTNVRLDDFTLTNPAGWTLHLFDCSRVTVNGIKIDNNVFTPNSDGIDITGGEDIMISNCYISTCDDAICLKTSPDSRECQRVTVTNCVIRTMCVALKLGNESYKDIRQVTFSNCVVFESSRAIGIYSQDGGVLEDITCTNIVADTRAPFIFNRPIHISLLQYGKTRGAVRNVTISNFTCKSEGRIMLTSEDGSMLENITLRDIKMSYPFIEDPQPFVEGARSKQFSPASPEARKAHAAVVCHNIKNLVLTGLTIEWPRTPDVPKDWQFPERIEHGGDRVFTPAYKTAREAEFAVVWGRNLMGGFIDTPLASPSGSGKPKYDVTGSIVAK